MPGSCLHVGSPNRFGLARHACAAAELDTSYFIGKLIQVLVCTVAETVLLMAVGTLFYHLQVPTAPGRWWTFAWIFLLGSTACGTGSSRSAGRCW